MDHLEYSYIEIKLKNNQTSNNLVELLEGSGINCVTQINDTSIYGIVDSKMCNIIKYLSMPEIDEISFTEPPNCK